MPFFVIYASEKPLLLSGYVLCMVNQFSRLFLKGKQDFRFARLFKNERL